MLIKEYRICLPMSVEEYRIAQLYMIQKKSREESHGTGSGVEILINEPYTDGPGGDGQYTHKIYHIGSHLPGWIKAILPKSALRIEEEAWNAYPYTRTRYKCPFVERFSLEIETRYKNDAGEQDNLFNLSGSDMRNRLLDYLDVVKDPIASGDYKKEEDPTLFISEKTGRGPLSQEWYEEYKEASKDTGSQKKHIMCAYKLCRVEFKYWGMQTKIEKFIHDIGLRKTMLRAHRQAWCWQDEYHGLTLQDIRRLEEETQQALKEKYAKLEEENEAENTGGAPNSAAELTNLTMSELEPEERNSSMVIKAKPKMDTQTSVTSENGKKISTLGKGRKQSWGSSKSKRSGNNSSRDLTDWHLESIENLQTSSSDEEEFFDAQEDVDERMSSNPKLFKSSSMEILTPEEDFIDGATQLDSREDNKNNDVFNASVDKKLEHFRNFQHLGASHSIDTSLPCTPTLLPSTATCKTTVLFLVVHGGSILDTGSSDLGSKHADISTFRSTLDSVIRAHYPGMFGHIATRIVSCPPVCSETLHTLAGLTPYSFDNENGPGPNVENMPLAAIPLFCTSLPDYQDYVTKVVNKANRTFGEFLRSEEGLGFTGQVCVIGDSLGAILCYDALCRHSHPSRASSQHGSHESLQEDPATTEIDGNAKKTNLETIKQLSVSNPDLTQPEGQLEPGKYVRSESTPSDADVNNKKQHAPSSTCPKTQHLSLPNSRRTSTGSQPDMGVRLEFEVSDFFMCGSPLGLVLAYRKIAFGDPGTAPRPNCHQVYNLFHMTDPSAIRIEPLLYDKFKMVAPIKAPRYQKFPLGDGMSTHLVETIQSRADVFSESAHKSHDQDPPPLERRQSNLSICSQISGHADFALSLITTITSKWWGNKRVDYTLYCPEALHSFPTSALPYLLHASYWESTDVAAFILRQVVRQDLVEGQDSGREVSVFQPTKPREKWLRRRTTIKLRNVGPNHRANDVIVLEDKPQVIFARFMYGPLDMVSLTGEKVDIHVMMDSPAGEWRFFGTEVTDSNGRVSYTIPDEKKLNQGMYPVKMVVRGDHTCVDCYLTVLPPKTETVVFSIDGSFTASVSIMGKDPKVRAGAVDVVRHWQDLGYLIVYVSARPDMQQKKVVAWLAQHNFPHGMVSFIDGLSADPLRQKANYLKELVNEAQIKVHAAYGSSKDISVYQSIGVKPEQIYIVGKVSKKHYSQAQILSEGYAAHLNDLALHSGSRPAIGNARMFIRKSCFGLPGQYSKFSKRAARRTCSLPPQVTSTEVPVHRASYEQAIKISETGNTMVDPGKSGAGNAVRARGTSPRVKVLQYRYDSSNV